jgi:hypothetical protein
MLGGENGGGKRCYAWASSPGGPVTGLHDQGAPLGEHQ